MKKNLENFTQTKKFSYLLRIKAGYVFLYMQEKRLLLLRISVKAHSLNGRCRTLAKGKRADSKILHQVFGMERCDRIFL